jgi:hypothetical protein
MRLNIHFKGKKLVLVYYLKFKQLSLKKENYLFVCKILLSVHQ